MDAFTTSLARELRFLRRSPPELFAATGLPLLLMVLMAWLMSAGVPRNLPIAVVDADHSGPSRALTRMLSAAPGIEVIARPTELEAAWSLLRRLEVYAVVHVPADMHRELARGETATVFGYYNGAYQTPGQIAYRDIQAATQQLGAQLLLTESAIAAGPASVRAPPVKAQRILLFNPQGSYEQYLGLLLHGAVLHLLLCLCAISALGRELRDGSAGDWLSACQGPALWAVLGKLAPYVLLFTLWGMLSLYFVRELRGPGIAGSVLLLAAAQLALYCAYAAIGLLFVAVTRNMTMSLSLAGFYAGASLAFANVIFPVETGSWFTRGWSALLPYTHYSVIQQQQVYFGAPWHDAFAPLGTLTLFVLIGGGVGAWQYARAAADPASWGRQ